MKIHDDELVGDSKKPSNVLDDLVQWIHFYKIVDSPESLGGVGIEPDPEIEIPNSIQELFPNVLALNHGKSLDQVGSIGSLYGNMHRFTSFFILGL